MPGITGWAQVNGRNAISWEQKFELDNYYVDNQSFWLDVKIIIKTIQKVLAQKDINASQDTNMPEFMGSTDNEVIVSKDSTSQ
jgi:lipopolysaccharide/colanic/teichoic acid biosynthesis glycosyltransferase